MHGAVLHTREIDRFSALARDGEFADLQFSRPLGADGTELETLPDGQGERAQADLEQLVPGSPGRRELPGDLLALERAGKNDVAALDRGCQLHAPRRIAECPLQRGEVSGGPEGLAHRAVRPGRGQLDAEAGPRGTVGQDMGRDGRALDLAVGQRLGPKPESQAEQQDDGKGCGRDFQYVIHAGAPSVIQKRATGNRGKKKGPRERDPFAEYGYPINTCRRPEAWPARFPFLP